MKWTFLNSLLSGCPRFCRVLISLLCYLLETPKYRLSIAGTLFKLGVFEISHYSGKYLCKYLASFLSILLVFGFRNFPFGPVFINLCAPTWFFIGNRGIDLYRTTLIWTCCKTAIWRHCWQVLYLNINTYSTIIIIMYLL